MQNENPASIPDDEIEAYLRQEFAALAQENAMPRPEFKARLLMRLRAENQQTTPPARLAALSDCPATPPMR